MWKMKRARKYQTETKAVRTLPDLLRIYTVRKQVLLMLCEYRTQDYRHVPRTTVDMHTRRYTVL